MPLNLPASAQEVEARSKADVQRELNLSNPFLKNSWLGAIVTAAANRIFDFYLQLRVAIKNNFPDTATGDYLTRWAAIWGKELISASKSNGIMVATGTAGTTIPAGTTLTVAGVGEFESSAAATISASVVNIDSFTRVGTTVTAITTSDHGLADNVPVTIADASETDYNGVDIDIIVTASDAFQYTIAATPVDEAGSSATASFTMGSVPVESLDFGAATNLDTGTKANLQSPLVGVDDSLTVDFGAVGGGTDQETETALRARMLDRIQNPVAQFNVAAIKDKAKQIAGVTRVFVEEVTPGVGQVTIYFMRDNDSNPIPVGSEVTKVKNSILEIKPANTADVDVYVKAPTAVTVDFTFTALTPNTSSMQTAISNNLRQFFDERTLIGTDVDEDLYRAAIANTVDVTTGETISSFTLSAPIGDIVVTTGQIGVLGSVGYP